jgi:L-ascorbate metabolism protein UlaG (beta-lactamase superfamily)
MLRIAVPAVLLVMTTAVPLALAQAALEKDVLKTTAGDLEITFVGHGSLVMAFGGKVVHIDPFGKAADYAKLPRADVVLITHHHFDHLDPDALKLVKTGKTAVVASALCADKVPGALVMKNGDTQTVEGIAIEAVPAYNIVHKNDKGMLWHPKGEGNGYVLGFGETRVYVAGDTENTPEMKALPKIDVAFLPMNLPYTMTPEMVADAAKAFKPKILYPYHTGDTDVSRLVELLKDAPGIEVRVRKMK